MIRRLVAVLLVAAAFACGGHDSGTSPTPPPSDRTFLSFVTESGFGLSPGQSMEFTPDNSTFSGYATSGVNVVNAIQVTARDRTGAMWGIWLAAPWDQQLAPGRYPNAIGNRSVSPNAARPGITFWNTTIAGCATGAGEFTVLEATYGGLIGNTSGIAIERFRATFEQRCVFNGQVLSAVKGEVNVPRRLE